MDFGLILLIFMVLGLGVAILSGYPVAFALAGVALLTAALGIAAEGLFGISAGLLDWGYVSLFPNRIFGAMVNEVLLAVPLFIAMGVMLEKSRVAEDLIEALGALFGARRGGLGIAVALVGALLAASTGIVGATVVTMGLLSLPTMLRRGYDPKLATGSIAAAGTLGQIIPPSIVLVILADVLSAAWQEAQREMGIFAPSPLSVGDLFAGALLPGLVLVGLYIVYLIGMAIFRPDSSPAISVESRSGSATDRHLVVRALLAPIFLILAVLGSILAGIATPTEAAALGAVGAILLGGLRCAPGSARLILTGTAALVVVLVAGAFVDLREVGTGPLALLPMAGAAILSLAGGWGVMLALYRLHQAGHLTTVLRSTTRITTMVFTVLIGAMVFSLVFRALGGDTLIEEFLTGLPGGRVGALIAVMLAIFLLGFVLDFIEITLIVVPIVAPVLLVMDINPIWLGVMIAVNLQTSFLTPPFGFALFYLRGVAPDGVTTGHIYRGVVPFVFIQLLMLLILAAIPELATWLPDVVFGN